MGGKQQKTMFHLFDPVYSSNMSAEREEVQTTGTTGRDQEEEEKEEEERTACI